MISLHRLIDSGFNSVQSGEIEIEHNFLTAKPVNRLLNSFAGNDFLAHFAASAEQSRHLNDRGVDDVEDELRHDADREHEQRDGHNHERLGSPEIGKPAATLRQRTAEERLHRARKHDCCDEKTDHGNGRERSGDGEGTFED